MLQNWETYLVLYLVFSVLFSQFYKLSVRNVKKDGAATIILQGLAGVSQLMLVPLFGWQLPNRISIVFLLIAACIFYAICDRLQTTSRKHLPVSDFAVLGQLATVFLIVYGVVIFRDPIVLTKIVGAAVIVLANILLLYKPHKRGFEVNKYHAVGALALLSFATAMSIDIGISEHFNLPFYIALTLLVPAVMISAAEGIKPKMVLDEWQHGNKRYYLATGLSWGLLILCSLRAYQYGEVNTIAPLQASAVVLNVVAAFVFLNERTHPYKKFVAATLVVLGVFLTVS